MLIGNYPLEYLELVREAGEIVGKNSRIRTHTNVYAPILDHWCVIEMGHYLESYREDPYLIGLNWVCQMVR